MTLAARPSTGVARRFRDVRATTTCWPRCCRRRTRRPSRCRTRARRKWRRAHTSWFFEEFLLEPAGGYHVYDATFRYLFNSYYEAVGPRHPRPHRGLVTRPCAAEVGRYRAQVDAAVERLLQAGRADEDVLALGLNHEQQHQGLLVMDAKHLLWRHPFGRALVDRPAEDDTRRRVGPGAGVDRDEAAGTTLSHRPDPRPRGRLRGR